MMRAAWRASRAGGLVRGCSTQAGVLRSVYPDVEVPRATVAQFMWRDLHLWPEKTALVCGVTGRQLRYWELQQACRSFAAGLRRQAGARDGDCVALLLPNTPEFAVAALGALEAGCVVSPVNIMYTRDEVGRQLLMSGATHVVTTSASLPLVQQATAAVPRAVTVIVVPDDSAPPSGCLLFGDVASETRVEVLEEVRRSPEDVAFLPYSSGTTGMPKGVQITHQNVVASICQQTLTDDLMLTLKSSSDFQDSMLCVVPFFHISGLMVQLMSRLNIGNKLITMPRFRPDHFVRLQAEYRTTAMLAAPPLALFLANYPEVDEDLMSSFRNILFGAAPSAEADLEKIFEKNTKITIAQGYGLTESTGVAIANKAGSRNFKSCGFMIANSQIKIVSSEDGLTALGYNQIGELWLRGPHIMKGYKDNETATRASFTEDGWFKTGDLGYIDKSSQEFYIVDRLKDLIKVKGYQVAPAELEGVLRLHPNIEDAAVVGVPHPQHGETPKAYVVVDDNEISVEDIKKFVAERVAPYKHISVVEYIDEIPKSPAGKILRRELKV